MAERFQGLGNFVPDDRGARLVVFEETLQLIRGVQRVVLDDGGAQAVDRVDGNDVLRTIGKDHGYAVALADAQ